jgi:hypothetical protein
MKTNPAGGTSNFGYPDPGYFSRVKQEFQDKGVTLDDYDSDEDYGVTMGDVDSY